MKTAIYCSVFTLVSLWSLSVFGQGSCHNDQGGGYPNEPGYPYEQPSPYIQPSPFGAGGTYFPAQPYTAPSAAVAPAAGPAARITLVSANSAADTRTASTAPSAKLSVVPDTAIASTPTTPKTIEVPAVEPEAIDSSIASLVGTWKAVARQGEGELTTVELHLDNRGWAELTVPGSDGKPSTTKSRVNFENQELKLTGSDKVVSLGKLVDFDSRQMVLERAEGQVTFVRL